MITNIRIENFKVFNKKVEMNLLADSRSKRFFTNYFSVNDYNILKNICIYGKNNVGKTCFIDAVERIKKVILNKRTGIKSNMFTDSGIVGLGISFVYKDMGYTFDFSYDTYAKEFIYEKYSQFDTTKKDKEERVLLLKDTINNKYFCVNEDLQILLPNLSNDNIVLYTAKTHSFTEIEELKNVFIEYAKKIIIIRNNTLSLDKTIELMKVNHDYAKEISGFLQKADLEINKFAFENERETGLKNEQDEEFGDIFKLVSYHKDIAVPFILYESTGTKKMAAMASYIVSNLKNGGALFIDEIDSGLHFILARAIIEMYNNEANANSQLIVTTHDINIMDCKKLLRKEQIWFAYKEGDDTYLSSLNEYKSRDGVRADVSNIDELYKKGILQNLPEPDLITWILEVADE